MLLFHPGVADTGIEALRRGTASGWSRSAGLREGPSIPANPGLGTYANDDYDGLEVSSCPRRCGDAGPAVMGTRPEFHGDDPVSDQRRGECGPDAADPVDERGECAGVLPVCRDDPRRQGSRGYGRDAADVVSGGAAASRADCLRADVDESRRRLALHRQQLQRRAACRPHSLPPTAR